MTSWRMDAGPVFIEPVLSLISKSERGVIMMILYKLKKTFWATIIKGDDKKTTSQVDSGRHISEYDEATQGQLWKIMSDQKQQEKGLPLSDELTRKRTIPRLPPGVEYIGSEKLDEAEKQKQKKWHNESALACRYTKLYYYVKAAILHYGYEIRL